MNLSQGCLLSLPSLLLIGLLGTGIASEQTSEVGKTDLGLTIEENVLRESAIGVSVDITADTGQRVLGPVTHWQTQDGDLIVEHLAGLDGASGDLIEFWSSPAVSNGKWQYVNISENTGHQIISTPLTSWQVPDGRGIAEHLAGQSPTGDLLVFFRSSTAPGENWQVVNVSQITGQQIGGSVTSWQTPDGEFIVEHLAGRSPTGDLLEFFWSPRADWQVLNVSANTGQQLTVGPLTSWQVPDGGGIAEHLAGQSPTGDLLVFFRSSTAPGENWQVVNVSQITGQQIGGSVTSWQTPDGEFIVEHLAVRSPTGDLLVFFWSPRADWQVMNVSEIAGGEPVTGTPTVYQVFDGLENVEVLGIRGLSGSLLLYSWKPSHDWQINDPLETALISMSSDPTTWLRILGGDERPTFTFTASDGNLMVVHKPRPRAVLAPTDLDARYTNAERGEGTLTWKDNSDNEDAFYTEFSKDGLTWTLVLPPLPANTTSTGFTVPVMEGETAYFRIRAGRRTGGGFSDFSDISNVATATRLPRPAAPSESKCVSDLNSNGNPFITLTWKDNYNSSDDYLFSIDRLSENESPLLDLFSPPKGVTRIVDSGPLQKGISYTYRVRVRRPSDGTFSNPSEATCKTSGEYPQTVFLGRKEVGVGNAFVYGGQWPELGQKNGILKSVFLARGFGPLLELRFIKPGHNSQQCDDPSAVVRLITGGTLSGQDLVQLFGTATPRLPVSFLACAFFNPPVPPEIPLSINILITYISP